MTDLDFERWELWVKPNRYDVAIIFLNVLISGEKWEPMDPELANDVTKDVNANEDYSNPRFMYNQLIKHNIITGMWTYNIEQVRNNLKANYKNKNNTENNLEKGEE